MRRFLTIGHSNFELAAFVELLRVAGVVTLCDVRSSPWTRYTPHFNRPDLARAMDTAGMQYAFLGDGLGARPKDPKCYRGGVALYDLIAKSDAFGSGLDAVRELAKNGPVALVCAERDPVECHRAILVARRLVADGDVEHLHSDGTVESHQALELRLLGLHRKGPKPMFPGQFPWAADIDEAYAIQEKAIAYQEKSGEWEAA